MAIILCAAGPFLAAALLLQLLTVLNVNPRDPVFGVTDKDYAQYRIEDLSPAAGLSVRTLDATPARASLEARGPAGSRTYNIDALGAMLGVSGPVYPIFWVPIKNPVLRAAPELREWRVRDVAGWFGPPDQDYIVKIERPFIWWDPLLQSQASYLTALFDESGRRAGEIIYDETCGLAFKLTGYASGLQARLIDTNFPISRNRIWLHGLHAALLALTGLAAWLWARQARPDRVALRGRALSLILTGGACIYLDTQLDIWEPFLLSKAGMIGLHAAVAAVLTLLWGRFSLPAWIELIVIVFYGHVERTGISPMAAFFPGISLAWLSVVSAQGPPPGGRLSNQA